MIGGTTGKFGFLYGSVRALLKCRQVVQQSSRATAKSKSKKTKRQGEGARSGYVLDNSGDFVEFKAPDL